MKPNSSFDAPPRKGFHGQKPADMAYETIDGRIAVVGIEHFDFAAVDGQLSEADTEMLASVFGELLRFVFCPGAKLTGMLARLIAIGWITSHDNFNESQLKTAQKLGVSQDALCSAINEFKRQFKLKSRNCKSDAQREKMRAAALARHRKERKQDLEP
jgi:hypothetical protein